MQKFLLKIIVLTVIAISYVTANVSYGQERYYGKATLEIWNSDILWAGQGNLAYNFTIDGQGLVNDPEIDSITNLVITTNFGDITFDEINASDAGRYVVGHLYSPEDIETIEIIKAIAVIKGKMIDITNCISIRDFKPVKITKR
jgi:hypothetical protein